MGIAVSSSNCGEGFGELCCHDTILNGITIHNERTTPKVPDNTNFHLRLSDAFLQDVLTYALRRGQNFVPWQHAPSSNCCGAPQWAQKECSSTTASKNGTVLLARQAVVCPTVGETTRILQIQQWAVGRNDFLLVPVFSIVEAMSSRRRMVTPLANPEQNQRESASPEIDKVLCHFHCTLQLLSNANISSLPPSIPAFLSNQRYVQQSPASRGNRSITSEE